jgi:hypothetical protein
MSKKPNKKMDKRCPRQLNELPCNFCPLAVQRLKALRHAERELTEEEEALLPGCPWAVNHQLANYCFFSMINGFLPDRQLSDQEIAHFCNVSIEEVKKIEKKSISKIRKSEAFKEVIDEHKGDKIMDDDADYTEWEFPS